MGKRPTRTRRMPSKLAKWGRRFLLLSLFLLTCGLAAPATGAAPMGQDLASQSERRLEYLGVTGYGQPVSAELTPEVMGHVWEFGGGAGDEITIAMSPLTEELDPFVLLLAMDEASLERLFALGDDELNELHVVAEELGVLLAYEDDWEGAPDAVIPSFVLPADGTYVILATSCCTGDFSGPYELSLAFAGSQPPNPPGQPGVQLRSYFPRQGTAGSETIVVLEGDGFSAIGSPVAVTLGGEEVPLLDAAVVDDQTVEMAIFIPPEIAPGEHEISFFFENAGIDGPFFVTEAEPGVPVDPAPVDPGPVDPAPVDPGPVDPGPVDPGPAGTGPGGSVNPGGIDGGSSGGPLVSWLPVIVGGGLLLLLVGAAIAGLAAIRLLRGPRPPANPPPAAPSIRFEHDWDAGRQMIEPAGRSLRPGVDIRFQLSAGKGRVSIDDGESRLAG